MQPWQPSTMLMAGASQHLSGRHFVVPCSWHVEQCSRCLLTCSAPSASSSSLSMRKPSSSYCEALPGFCERFAAEAATGGGCCLGACPGAACCICCGSCCGASRAGAVLPAENLHRGSTRCLGGVVCRKHLFRHTYSRSIQLKACSTTPYAAAAGLCPCQAVGMICNQEALQHSPGTGCSCPF